MGREFPGNTSPVGKPSVKVRQAATPCGKLEIHTGHGKEYGQVSAERSFTGKSSTSNGATSKGGLSIGGGHGTEYGQTSSRG
jgi:hypothetical protein